MIIDRYITKEIILNFTLLSGILLFVALCNRFIGLLAKVAIGQLPANLVVQVMALYIPELFAGLAPLALFIAIILVYSRLYADSEMAVLFTSGVNWRHLNRIAFRVAFSIAILVLLTTTYIMPTIAAYRDKVVSKGEAVGMMQAIIPGQFQSLDSGRLVFYVEDLAKKQRNHFAKIFIAEQFEPDHAETTIALLTAQTGYLETKTGINGEEFFLVLQNGKRYTGSPGALDYTVVDFKEYGRCIETTPVSQTTDKEILSSTLRLLRSNKPSYQAELQWRFALPIATLILSIIAVAIAKVKPRQGRFAKFLPAILVYIAYFNLMLITKRWVIAGVLPAYLGIWLVHLGFLIVGGFLLAYASGRAQQFYRNYFGDQ